MRKVNITLFILAFLTVGGATFAQVWTEPAFPSKFDDVTVYFDAAQGNGALAGFTGDVYAHAGVITSESTNGNDWRYVVGNWGTADSRVLMTREDDDLYSISYNISDFYGIPPTEEVLKLAFVFRNINETIVGRASDGSDIYTDVYPDETELLIDFRSPSGQDQIYFADDSVLVEVVLSDTANLSIYDNDVLVFSGDVSETTFYLYPTEPGEHVLRCEAAKDTLLSILEQSYILISGNPTMIDPPPGTVDGLNYYTDSTYLFQLHAPDKEYAFVLCPANEYKVDGAFQMNPGEDGSTWWVELPRSLFTNGRNTYQYLVSNGIRVGDPYSTYVLVPWDDPFVADDVKATCPPYPEGMTLNYVTAFDTTYRPYDFIVDDFEKPAKAKLVIYELLLRDFLHDHSFTALLDTLDYFEKLGVNAIELMPIHEFEGNLSWGYNPAYHMAVDKYYGTRDQLKAFIDAAHERGIAVIQDVVFNHTYGYGPWAQMYWDPANSRPAPGNPYLNVIPRHPFNVGSDFNHESEATKRWVKHVLSYWIKEFKFDGFRFDLSKGMTQFNSGNDEALMARYDPGRIAILKDYADHIWSIDPTSYVILEHFADNDEETELSNYGMMIWGNSNYEFNEAAMGYASDLEWIDYTVRGWNDPHVVGYMESHDEQRLMYRINNFGDDEGEYNTRETTTALERIEAVSAIFYSIPGPKMLWQFGELGYDYSIFWCPDGTTSDNCKVDPKPIRWDYLTDYRREKLRQVTAALIHLHTSVPTFSTRDFEFGDGNFYLKTVHLNHPDMDATVLANFRVINSDITPRFQYTGTWYEYLTGDTLNVTNTDEKITFKPGEYRIYTSKKITPPNGLISAAKDLPVSEVSFYPSLVTTRQSLYATLPDETQVRSVVITDITGGTTTYAQFHIDSGDIAILPDADLPAGMYMVTIEAETGMFVGRFVRQ